MQRNSRYGRDGRGGSNFRSRGNYRGRSGGQGRAYSKHTTQPRGLFADSIWHCDCKPRLPAEHFKVKKEGKNQGRWFYTCQQSEPQRCGFFLWEEDAKPREEAAVLSNRRTEPMGDTIVGSGKARITTAEETPTQPSFGNQKLSRRDIGDDESTQSPTPSPDPRSPTPKRKASQLDIDDEDDELLPWSATDRGGREQGDTSLFETPRKSVKTGIYATPATSTKRKLPWLEDSETTATDERKDNTLNTPSKTSTHTAKKLASHLSDLPTTPTLPPSAVAADLATAQTPTPPSRHRDALHDPDDSRSTLTSEVFHALGNAKIALPPEVHSTLRSILTKHDLKTQGITKGREITRLALRKKDARIAELQNRIVGLEAEREMDRGTIRALRKGRLDGM